MRTANRRAAKRQTESLRAELAAAHEAELRRLAESTEPEGQHYLEIPYRTLSHPAVTLWEQRQALAKLRQQGREQVDESALFRMIGQMREIVSTAQKATRKARRDADRRQHLKATAVLFKTTPPPDADMADPQADNQPPAKPFDQIEEW